MGTLYITLGVIYSLCLKNAYQGLIHSRRDLFLLCYIFTIIMHYLIVLFVSTLSGGVAHTEYGYDSNLVEVDGTPKFDPVIRTVWKREILEVTDVNSQEENKANRLSKSTEAASKVNKFSDDFPEVNEIRVANQSSALNFSDSLVTPFELENSTEITGYTFTNISLDVRHKYYNSFYYKGSSINDHFWVDFSSLDSAIHSHPLSQTYRQATPVTLSFEFPFYGHLIKKVTLTTGGYLYTGKLTHSFLAEGQYIAPLMGNFHTSASNLSGVQYYDNGTAFVVQWDNIALKDDNLNRNFTFQVTLLQSGDIIFGYKKIPIPISEINESSHPVKVGISDAYLIDRIIFYTRRKTLYEYHKVELKEHPITNDSFIYFEALPTCLGFTDCQSCTTTGLKYDCKWCDAASRCSDGLDRHKQNWMSLKCNNDSLADASLCDDVESKTVEPVSPLNFFPMASSSHNPENSYISESQGSSESNIAIIVSMLGLLGCISGIIVWVIYAYRNPQTPSGQFLIRYRPTQWSFKRGEHRYTAAVAKT